MIVHLDVGREKSINAIDQAMLDKGNFSGYARKPTDEPDENDIYQIERLRKSDSFSSCREKFSFGWWRLYRAKIEKYLSYDPYIKVAVSSRG